MEKDGALRGDKQVPAKWVQARAEQNEREEELSNTWLQIRAQLELSKEEKAVQRGEVPPPSKSD